MKHRVIRVIQKYVLNPPVRALLAIGIAPPFYALLETTGRVSGKPRRTPVGNGLDGDTFWLITELGHQAHYVRNIQANPQVRVRVRQGLRLRWRTGTARLVPDDDPKARQRAISRRKPGRQLTALAVRTMGTELLTVRIDLERVDSAAK
jgi:deazaflavin-dependent oxidoreductase (nitroreductase family)